MPRTKKTDVIDVEPDDAKLSPEVEEKIAKLKKTLLLKQDSDTLFVAFCVCVFLGTWFKFSLGTAFYVTAVAIGISLATEIITLRRIRVLAGNTNAPIDGLIDLVNAWVRFIKDKMGKF